MSEQQEKRKRHTPSHSRSLMEQIADQAARAVRFENHWRRDYEDDLVYRGFSIKLPDVVGADVLVVVRAWLNGAPVVAFVSGGSLWEALAATFAKIENRSLKWKEDEYA